MWSLCLWLAVPAGARQASGGCFPLPRMSRPAARAARAAAWGIGLLAAGAVQGAGALTAGLAFTSPGGFAARALIALAIEAILAALTIAWLHRNPAPRPQARNASS